MKDKDIHDEINSIKNIMERSTKFISLSGLSGVLAGIYALIGACLAYQLLYVNVTGIISPESDKGFASSTGWYTNQAIIALVMVAFIVLILSITTGIWLTLRKARRNGQKVWNQSSRSLLQNGAIPLLVGGIFIVILLAQGYYGLITASCLIFYGLALIAASQYTYGDVRWLGLSEIVLGLLAMFYPLYGLYIWALGFGVLHILYGSVMYFKYDREDRPE